jgi:hypothetical protein
MMSPVRKMAGRPDAAFEAKLRAWLAGNSKAKATWKHRRPDLPDQSMDGYDAELQRLALADGWTHAELERLTAAHHEDWAGKAERIATMPAALPSPSAGMLDSPAVAVQHQMTTAQKRIVIAKLLKLQPELSNRQIAAQTKVHHETVASVRRELEGTGEIRRLDKTTGSDGKARPARSSKFAPMTPAEKAKDSLGSYEFALGEMRARGPAVPYGGDEELKATGTK